MERPTRLERLRELRFSSDDSFIDESGALQSVTEQLIHALEAENAELRRQLVAARSMLQECTHERVDPNRDPFGGMAP